MNSRALLLLLIVAALCGGSACRHRQPLTPPVPTPTGEIRDDRGKAVRLSGRAKRIVSLSPAATETLFALGVGDRVVGVTDFCDYPPQAAKIERMGGYLDPNVEKVAAATPDLIVVQRGTSSEVLKALDYLKAETFVLDPHTYDGVVDGISRLGALTRAENTDRVVSRMRLVAVRVRSQVAQIPQDQRPKVLLGDPHLADESGLWVPGANTLHHDLLVRAGGQNIAGDVLGDWQALSLEVILQRQPEVIITTCKAGEDPQRKRAQVQRRLETMAGWSSTPAVRESRIYVMQENVLLRPGPRIADALWTIAHFLHPDMIPEEMPL